MKGRGTLLMALPKKDQLKFHSYKDAKLLMKAIKKRYGGNKESKKVQRTLLKQQYENFTGLSSDTMDQTFDRLQKLISQLEIQDEVITQEDMNLKQEIETISLDDLYNNLKIYEPEISGSSSISQNPQNVAFVSSNSTKSNSSTNEADNTAYGVSATYTQSNAASGDNLKDLEQIDPDDLEEMDLQWEMATLTIRARRFIKRISRKLDVNGQRNLEKAEKERDELKLTLKKFQNSSKSLNNLLESQVVDKFKTGLGYNAASSTAASPAVESFVNTSEMLENQEHNKSKSDKGYHAVPPPFTRNFIPFKPDLTFMDEIVKSENMDVTTIVTPSNVKVELNHESAGVKKIIPKNKTVSSSTEKIKFVKSARETIEKGKAYNTAVRPVNTAGSKPTMNHPRPISNAYKNGYSQVTRPFNKYSKYKNNIFNKKVNTVRVKDTTARDRAVDIPTVRRVQGKRMLLTSGCSSHINGTNAYLTEYEDYDGVSELSNNLFSVSQICDKKNNVLFTDTECLVLSSDFKLLDESQVLLRVPRKDNIYSVDLKSVVPTKGLTCLFAKATIDESNLWNKRLGHINFKNINKLVKGNLVRGLPSKIFENNHSCVAMSEGKATQRLTPPPPPPM
ncbi:putative ribonuclease H-like domain-containing protein [Tanacetum coccineum]